jgi:hypothetical protein
VREALRETDVVATIKGAAEAIGESIGRTRVFCREAGCGRSEGYSAIQITPTTDRLVVEGYYAETIGDYAKQGSPCSGAIFATGRTMILAPSLCASHLSGGGCDGIADRRRAVPSRNGE